MHLVRYMVEGKKYKQNKLSRHLLQRMAQVHKCLNSLHSSTINILKCKRFETGFTNVHRNTFDNFSARLTSNSN